MTLDSRPADDPSDLPLKRASGLLDELLESPQRRVRLWAPTTVALEARVPLYVHAGVFGAPAELDRLAFAERAVIVAVDEATGETQVVRMGGHGGRDAPKRLAATPGFEGGLGRGSSGAAAQVVRCAMWDATTAGWATGRYRVTAVVADRTSNDEVVEIVRSTATVDRAVRAAEGAQVWPPPDHAGGLPRYDSVDGSPTPPADHGVALASQRVVSAGAATCALYGAVRSVPSDTHRVAYGALLPITLVITGSETPGPWVVRMRIPSFARDAVAGERGVTARFAIDLFRLAPLASSPQTYFVHAFTADGKSAPLPIAVVGGS